jgi:hypothetical protein
MTDTIFRSAKTEVKEKAPVSEPQNPDRPESVEVEAPVALYEEIEGIPYTAKYFGVEKIWDDPDIGMADDVKVIDSYYRQKVQNKDLEDGKKSYESFIKEIEKATNTKNSPHGVKIAKMAEFTRFMKKMEEIDKLKHKFSI